MRRSATFGLFTGAANLPARRAAISAITLGMFVFRLMLAAIPMAPPPAAADAVLVPICTADGLKWLKIDPDAPAQPSQASIDCPLCLAAHGLAMVPLSILVLPLPAERPHPPALAFHREAPILRIAARPPPSRGPPLLSMSETRA